MSKNKPSKKNHNLNWEILKDKTTKKSLTIGDLLKRLEKDPWSIIDYDIRYAIEKLREYCIWGSESRSKRAKGLLKQILECFIPKGSDCRKTKSSALRRWQRDPFFLVQILWHYENEMRPGWEEGKTKKEKRERAFEGLFGRSPTKEEFKEVTQGERDATFTNFVLSCFCAIWFTFWFL